MKFMKKKEEIELSPMETTAYWWVNSLRHRVREIEIGGARDENEALFAQIFDNYTERDWRKVYLGLVKEIFRDVKTYIPEDWFDVFSQDTAKGGHERLNDELSKITGQQIPDICLSSRSSADLVIYTTFENAGIRKSGGIHELSPKCESCYVLTGDEKGLDFDNLLLATIAVLSELDESFCSVLKLREGFCDEYVKKTSPEQTINEVVEKFNASLNRAMDKKVIGCISYSDMYFTSFPSIYYIELAPYKAKAYHYANVILQKTLEAEEIPLGQKLEKKMN